MDGELPEGATATDLVLTVTQMLRERGVVGKFVEFFGPGLANMPLADRATIGNMSPEFGSTCAIFPVDAETLRYLEFTGRPTETLELVEAYAREQGMFHDEDAEDAVVLGHAGAGPGHGRAVAWPAPSARRTGSRCPTPPATSWPSWTSRTTARRPTTAATARATPSRPATRRPPMAGQEDDEDDGGPRTSTATRRPTSRRRAPRSPTTARSSTSRTARWSSPPSPPAPTPPTPRSCWAPGCWRATRSRRA